MNQRYIIGAVYKKDAGTPKESAQHIIGRTGLIEFLEKDSPMWFEYDSEELKGQAMRTSFVEKFDENDNGIWIYTENSVYRFDTI